MAELAAAHEPADLYRRGFRLYEQFRPAVPAGELGWGAKGELDLSEGARLRANGLGQAEQTLAKEIGGGLRPAPFRCRG